MTKEKTKRWKKSVNKHSNAPNIKNKSVKNTKKTDSKKQKISYNREALRLEFLVSPINDLSERWRHKWGTNEAPQNGNFKKHTKGWVEEKKQLREEVVKEAMEELKKEMVEAYKPTTQELSEAHQALFTLIRAKIRLMQWGDIPWAKITDVDVRDLKALWEMVKIEKWEPTRYIQQDTTATITQEEVTPEELQKIQSLLSSDQHEKWSSTTKSL